MNRLALMVLKNIHRAPGLYAKLCHYAKHTDKYPEQEKWDHIHKIMEIAVKSGNIDLQVTGLENIPGMESDGFLMYGNHQGMFDVVAIAATVKPHLAAVLKKELVDVPLLKQIRLCTHSYDMDREDVRQSLTVIQNVTKDVQNGKHFLIFPEGTRSRNGNVMGEFHGGSFRCALKAKCPIIPFAIIDSFKVLDEKGSKPVTVQLHYLKPIPYEEYKDMKTVDLAALVKQRIQEAIDASVNPTEKE
jgi:1-acyl-sn-glycerol-3-phosphate acyltransferase